MLRIWSKKARLSLHCAEQLGTKQGMEGGDDSESESDDDDDDADDDDDDCSAGEKGSRERPSGAGKEDRADINDIAGRESSRTAYAGSAAEARAD